jgi:hypothetical protein
VKRKVPKKAPSKKQLETLEITLSFIVELRKETEVLSERIRRLEGEEKSSRIIKICRSKRSILF